MKHPLDILLWIGAALCPLLIGVAWADWITGFDTLVALLASFR